MRERERRTVEFEKRERAGDDEKSGIFFPPGWDLGDWSCESFKTAKTTSFSES